MTISTSLLHLWNDDSGQDIVEYALILAVVGLGCVVAMKTLATSVGSVFSGVSTTVTSNI